MIDDSEKYKDLISIPEHPSISYDLHKISISHQSKKNNSKRFIYMKKYRGEGSILDFYKPNSNILSIKEND
ncbi:hypothetical protein [Aquimarina longa]|uniref:hypothetical protein n=1 Tax=Aquimarina longa TaxID=1080221 RepID=UPI0007841855|nr:hypothetical protein [Aquimarina longa]